jgi:hypothetical protein
MFKDNPQGQTQYDKDELIEALRRDVAVRDGWCERMQSSHDGLEAERKALREQLAASQAYAERLREAIGILRLKTDPKYGIPIADKVLAIPNDDTALRQWGANLLQKAADAWCIDVSKERLHRFFDELEKK